MITYEKPYLVAEIGCNHKGDMEIAREMIRTAARFCNADAVKFQKRNVRELLSQAEYDAPHPVPENSYGETYGKHREFLEFTIEQHRELKACCEENGVDYSSSVWDFTSAREIASLSPAFIKIPSASNNNYEMLQWLCEHYSGELMISVGMTSRREEEELVELLEKRGRAKDVTLLACTSGYPVADEDMCLLEITRLREAYLGRVKRIGFSSHHTDTALDVAAYTLGAVVVERHFTLNRAWKGTDHAASLEPEALRQTKRNLLCAQKALTYKQRDILPVEDVQRRKLKHFRDGRELE